MSNGMRFGKAVFAGGLLVLGLIHGTAAGQGGTSKEKGTPLFDYRQITLANGLKVITLEDFSCPIVSVQVWYHVGSKDENPARQGFAHMFEHMMFQGTDRLGPTDHFGLIRKIGGSCNGYTSFDRTVYLETLPANQLDLALWLEAERMTFLKIDQTAFDTERKVVEEEARVKLNQPYGTLVDQLMADIYKVHPYQWTPIGKISHLRAASVQELRDFWTRYYIPSNATLVIVGAVKHAEAQQQAKKYFGWIPSYPAPALITAQEPPAKGKRQITIHESNAPAPGTGVVFRTVPPCHEDSPALDLLAEILGGGNSSRLYRELVAEKQLAVMAQAGAWSFEQDGLFGAGALLSPLGGDPKGTLAVIEKQIDRLRKEPVSERELLKAKNQQLRGLVTESLTDESKASMLGTAALDLGNVSEVNREMDRIRKVTAADILRVAQKYLAPDRMMEVTVVRNLMGTLLGSRAKVEGKITAVPEKVAPKPGRKGLVRSADFPKTPPRSKPLAAKITPAYQSQTLANGLKVLVVPNHEVPFISVQLGLLAGGWTEARAGTASMAMSMLTKGTAKHNEGQLAEELETYAISLDGAGEMDTCSLGLSCLTEQIGRGMNLLAEVVLCPTFPENEFGKLRKQVLTSLAVSSEEPEYVAEREYRRRLYGNHPYSRTATGEIEDVQALKIQDLKLWWSTYARPDMAVLIFSGDIDPSAAFKLAQTTLGNWQAKGPKPEKKLPVIAKPGPTHIYLIDRPCTQSQIQVGQLGITRQDEGYFPSRIVSSYFGWGFDGRLNKNLRVQKGLTYNVFGSYLAQRFAGEFKVGTFSKTETTAQAVKAVLDEIAKLKTEGPTREELEGTRSYILGSFIGERETPQQIARDLWLIQSQGLSDDYLERLLSAVAKISSQDCEKLTKSTLQPDRLVVVVVGDAAKIKTDLEKIAPVTVITTKKDGPASGSTTKPVPPPVQVTKHKSKKAVAAVTPQENPRVELQTTMGNIILELNRHKAPITVANFIQYVNDGFYTGKDGKGATIFHRVIPGFMVQGGGFTVDMVQKTTREPLQNESNNGLSNLRGTIAMARTRNPNSATSQFFINVANNTALDHGSVQSPDGYTVFGRVIQGMDIVDTIVAATTHSITVQGQTLDNVPVTSILIKSATVLPKNSKP
jgi:zinc protease